MDVRKYIGIPYVTGGEDFNGVDCYTLCRLFSRNELGRELPDHSQSYRDGSVAEEAQGAIRDAFDEWKSSLASRWSEVDEPEIGDVIIFNFYGAPTHCAVYIGDNKCLHACEGVSSHLADLYGGPWERRMKGIMRWN